MPLKGHWPRQDWALLSLASGSNTHLPDPSDSREAFLLQSCRDDSCPISRYWKQLAQSRENQSQLHCIHFGRGLHAIWAYLHVNPSKRQPGLSWKLRIRNHGQCSSFLMEAQIHPSLPLPLLSSSSRFTLPPSFPPPSPSLLSPYFPSFLNVLFVLAVVRIVTADAGYVKSNHRVLLAKNFDSRCLRVLVSLPL